MVSLQISFQQHSNKARVPFILYLLYEELNKQDFLSSGKTALKLGKPKVHGKYIHPFRVPSFRF